MLYAICLLTYDYRNSGDPPAEGVAAGVAAVAAAAAAAKAAAKAEDGKEQEQEQEQGAEQEQEQEDGAKGVETKQRKVVSWGRQQVLTCSPLERL